MTGDPRVLVLMVTGNGQAYLNRQLKSILGQRGAEVTLRVSDDCSADSSYRILETFAGEHPNIELRYHGHPAGADRRYLELLYGADADAFDYIAFSGQGDAWHPDRLLAGMRRISANTSRPELCYGNVREIDERGKTVGLPDAGALACAGHPASLLLVPNWARGCTMLMNGALAKLLRAHPVYDIGRDFDTWVHAVALFCGGYAFADLGHRYVSRRVLPGAPAGERNYSPESLTRMAGALLRAYPEDIAPDIARVAEDVVSRQTSLAARLRLARDGGILASTAAQTRRLRRDLLLKRL